MEIATQPQLTINGVDVWRVVFTSKQFSPPANVPVNLNVVPKVFYPKEKPDDFVILIDAVLSLPNYYELSIGIMGRFSIKGVESQEIRKRFINANAPAILFPYLRSFVSTFSANLGATVNPIMISPQFFKGDLEEVALPVVTP